MRRTIQKFSQLFRHRYKRIKNASNDAAKAQEGAFSRLFGNDAWAAPRKRNAIQTYTRLHYRARMKAEYDRRFAISYREWETATEPQRLQQELKRPVPVAFRTKVIREYWDAETEDFRASMEQESVNSHEEAMEEWEAAKSAPMTPQQFHR